MTAPPTLRPPSPWTYQNHGKAFHALTPKAREHEWFTIRDARNCYLAEILPTDAATWDAAEDTARLLAAAPDLLAALEEAERCVRLLADDVLNGIEFDSTHAKYLRRDADEWAKVVKAAKGE